MRKLLLIGVAGLGLLGVGVLSCSNDRETKRVFDEDLGIGLPLGTHQRKVDAVLGQPVKTLDTNGLRGLFYGPVTWEELDMIPLCVQIEKSSGTVSAIYVYDAQSAYVREKLTLFGKGLGDITLDYLRSVLPSGTTGSAEPVGDKVFHWVSPSQRNSESRREGHEAELHAFFRDTQLVGFWIARRD